MADRKDSDVPRRPAKRARGTYRSIPVDRSSFPNLNQGQHSNQTQTQNQNHQNQFLMTQSPAIHHNNTNFYSHSPHSTNQRPNIHFQPQPQLQQHSGPYPSFQPLPFLPFPHFQPNIPFVNPQQFSVSQTPSIYHIPQANHSPHTNSYNNQQNPTNEYNPSLNIEKSTGSINNTLFYENHSRQCPTSNNTQSNHEPNHISQNVTHSNRQMANEHSAPARQSTCYNNIPLSSNHSLPLRNAQTTQQSPSFNHIHQPLDNTGISSLSASKETSSINSQNAINASGLKRSVDTDNNQTATLFCSIAQLLKITHSYYYDIISQQHPNVSF